MTNLAKYQVLNERAVNDQVGNDRSIAVPSSTSPGISCGIKVWDYFALGGVNWNGLLSRLLQSAY